MSAAAQVLRLQRVGRTVADIDQARAFYRDALGFHVVAEATHDGDAWSQMIELPGARARSVTMHLGDQEILLVAFDPMGRRYPDDSAMADQWSQHMAIVVTDIAAAYAQLSAYPFMPISADGPQQLPQDNPIAFAYKFRDLDGHPLELVQFRAGGDARWRRKSALFCGIAHHAITVADLARSTDFYTRLLGLGEAARGVKAGPEQARLDNAPDVLLHAVTLQPAAAGPPQLQLLDYARPSGRPVPPNARANDVFADRMLFQVRDLAGLIARLKAEDGDLLVPPVVTLGAHWCGVQLRDPTGHLLILIDRPTA